MANSGDKSTRTFSSQVVDGMRVRTKTEPVIEGIRKEENNQNYYLYFEYLYNEVKKREQKLQSKA